MGQSNSRRFKTKTYLVTLGIILSHFNDRISSNIFEDKTALTVTLQTFKQ